MALALKRRGFLPEVYVSRPGPYFLETVKGADKRRVMQVTQTEFHREARTNDIPSHLTPVSESVLMKAFDAGSVAIVLVSGYHMVPRGRPHWIFAFGRDGGMSSCTTRRPSEMIKGWRARLRPTRCRGPRSSA